MLITYFRQTTSDGIELSEASLDLNLSGSNLRCKVAPGTPPLNNITIYERNVSQHVVVLAATVSSVHRLVFPHPSTLDKKVIQKKVLKLKSLVALTAQSFILQKAH